ncbi:MAG: carboxypeptidase regulatory-like domain-containing protein [Candidatus Electryonea clarkiae]|nr:carboxypeptidase regulatory-like domain-containing protein [Candidatus Electryonea clarkiae]MDP8287630.1 carboxypeptidase regulatory-like domain-containing protein [Candidatus Electryonea clarkiae]
MARFSKICLLATLLLTVGFTVHVFGASGGADDFGYYWVDSDEMNGPEYDWIDISRTGDEVRDMGDDDYAGPFELPWTFSFYGNEYDEVYISSNGFLSFGVGSSDNLNQWIPDRGTPNNLIALCWRDLDPSESGNIYYGTDEDGNWICQFENVAVPGFRENITAEVILQESGDFLFQYSECPTFNNNEDNFTSLGIENATGFIGLLVNPWDETGYPDADISIMFSLLDMNASLSGTITSEETGEPVANAWIELWSWNTNIRLNFNTISDENGEYAIPEMASATYDISVNADGFGRYEETGYFVDEGENLYDVDLGSPPEIAIDLDTVRIYAGPGTIGDSTALTIYNNGGTEMFFFVNLWTNNEPVDWVIVSPNNGNIAPRDSMEIYFSGDATNLEFGEYTHQVQIFSDDPNHEPIMLPIILTVSAEPPGEFALESPAEGTELALGYHNFTWHQAPQVTPGVQVLYDIYISTDPGYPGELIAENLHDTSSVRQIETRGRYYWTVLAHVIPDEGTWANSANSFTVGLRAPETFDLMFPENESAHDLGEVTLIWENAHDPDGDQLSYAVFISTDPNDLDEPYATGINESYFVFDVQDAYRYYWKIRALDGYGQLTDSESTWSFQVVNMNDASEIKADIPKEFAIQSLHPNPFNSTLNIVFAVPELSNNNLSVYDILGRQIAVLGNGQFKPGYHQFAWNAQVSSGIYFLNINSSSGWTETRKITLIK